jgi:CheY-like chemotaxis protein
VAFSSTMTSDPPDSPQSQRSPISQGPHSGVRSAGPVRLLIADRDAGVRRQLRELFAHLEANVDEVTGGDALDLALQKGSYDLVLTAAQLSGPSGLQVLARARSRGMKAPFVVITAKHDLLLRVMVSESEGAVLSSRVVDLTNFGILATELVSRSRTARGA